MREWGFFCAKGKEKMHETEKKNVLWKPDMVAEKRKGANVITKVLHQAGWIYKWFDHVKLPTQYILQIIFEERQ